MSVPTPPPVGGYPTPPHDAQAVPFTAQQDAGAPYAAATAQPAVAPKKLNVLALVSLIVAAIGFIFACIPGALIVGWILLPIAFVLSLVSLFLKGEKSGSA